jgi:hypothetical protein
MYKFNGVFPVFFQGPSAVNLTGFGVSYFQNLTVAFTPVALAGNRKKRHSGKYNE